VVGKAIGGLRSFVYFSLGSGPMGWIALARKEGLVESILWAAISGFLIAIMAKALRRFLRRDLDSSLHDGDFVMEAGTVTVPIAEGEMGKVRVRKFGAESELYARMRSGSAAKGEAVRVVDYDSECYYVEKEAGLSALEGPDREKSE
jgi:membrane protein implicated in regulation of membrane protease activity